MAVKSPFAPKAPVDPTAPYSIPDDLNVPDRLKEIFREAHDLLARPGGWIKGKMSTIRKRPGTDYHGYCILGALREVTSLEKGDYNKASDFLSRKVLGKPVATWNDNRNRKREHVLSLLEELYD